MAAAYFLVVAFDNITRLETVENLLALLLALLFEHGAPRKHDVVA